MAKVTIKLLLPAADGTDSKQDDAYDIYKMKEKFDMSENVPTISVIHNHIVKEILSLNDCDNEETLSGYFKKIKLRYLDEDGDFVVMRNDKDLIDAIESILEQNDNPKKISVKIYIRHNLQSVIDGTNENGSEIDKTKTKKKKNKDDKKTKEEKSKDKENEDKKDSGDGDTKAEEETEPEPEIGPIGPSFVCLMCYVCVSCIM